MGLASVLLAAAAVMPVPLPGSSQPAWAPNGARLAYVKAVGQRYHFATRSGIYVAELGSGRERALAGGGGYNTGPAWSPDGRRIAYVWTSYDRRQGALMLMKSNGHGKRVLVRGFVSRPAWSPDTTMLAYVADGRLRLLTLATGLVSDLGRAEGTDPAWSRDGPLIALAGRCKLAFERRPPAMGDFEVVESYVGPDTAWSRDGYRMAWSCLIDGRWSLIARDRRRPGLAFGCP